MKINDIIPIPPQTKPDGYYLHLDCKYASERYDYHEEKYVVETNRERITLGPFSEQQKDMLIDAVTIAHLCESTSTNEYTGIPGFEHWFANKYCHAETDRIPATGLEITLPIDDRTDNFAEIQNSDITYWKNGVCCKCELKIDYTTD